jgi:AcrR family transcriptional regulator
MSRAGSARGTPAQKAGYHHGDLRQALLDATLRLVDQHGPQGFTLRAAARAAGVTAGATYHHFEDKEALLAAVAEEGFELFRQALQEAAQRAAPSARERSHNVGVAYVLFAVRHPTRFRVMVGYGVQARLRREGGAASAMATYELVRDVLIEGLKDKPTDAISNAEVLGWWSVVHGLSFLAIDGHLGETGTSPKRAEVVVRTVIDALERRERSAPPQ